MKFLIFYIISTAICIFIALVVTKSLTNRFKREYPAICEKLKKNTKYSISEKISRYLFLFVPIINIIYGLIFIFSQKQIYEKMLEEFKIRALKEAGEKPNVFDWTLEELEAFLENEE